MGRASFEYDEVGNTFYYVLVSFYALLLIPATYFLLPFGASPAVEVVNENECQCDGCVRKRRQREANKPHVFSKKVLKTLVIIVAWAVFIFLVKKMSEIEVTHQEYDPYAILQVDRGAEVSEIKKAYRELSRKHHPDRGGDPVLFDKIAKAHQALTDDESRKNWELYGNPDGPTATTFGIALPKWLVSQEYGMIVLAFYGLIFMILLPTVVGFWWYNSVKYNLDKVLLETTKLFWHFVSRNPRMEVQRVVTILSGAFEFCAQMNKDIIERESDNVELPRLMKYLPLLGENKKEMPFSRPYSLKARILMHGHFSRLNLESPTLEEDQRYVLNRIGSLIEEILGIAQQAYFYTELKVTTDTIDNIMRASPMFIQGLWPKNSPLLQLPHLSEYNLQHLRRQRIFNCPGLANLDADKRRNVLKSLSDSEYRDVLVVLSSMPRLSIHTELTVEGEEDSHEITAGCVVTLKVTLTRQSLLDPRTAGIDNYISNSSGDNEDGFDDDDLSQVSEQEDKEEGEENENKPKRKVWEKPQKKKKGGKSTAAKKKLKQQKKVAAAQVTPTEDESKKDESVDDDQLDAKNEDDEPSDQSDFEDQEPPSTANSGDDSDYENDDWPGPQKKVSLEAKSHKTHPVHCPRFPGEKFEWWWLSLNSVDKKTGKQLLAPTVFCKTLIDSQTIPIRFTSPPQKGLYNLQLVVRSDSYMDAEYGVDIKLDVKPAKEIVLPKYEDEEDEEDDAVVSSDEYTEGSASEDDDE